MMKSDENVVRTHENGKRGVEYGQRNGETNFYNKCEPEKRVPKWSQRIHQLLAGKQISMYKHTTYSPDMPCVTPPPPPQN
jgi:hypothetical protein